MESRTQPLPASSPRGGAAVCLRPAGHTAPRPQDVGPEASLPPRALPSATAPPSDCGAPRSGPLRCGGRRAPGRMRQARRRASRSLPSRHVARRMRGQGRARSPPHSLGACARRGFGNRQKGRGRNALLRARAALGAWPGSADSGAGR